MRGAGNQVGMCRVNACMGTWEPAASDASDEKRTVRCQLWFNWTGEADLAGSEMEV